MQRVDARTKIGVTLGSFFAGPALAGLAPAGLALAGLALACSGAPAPRAPREVAPRPAEPTLADRVAAREPAKAPTTVDAPVVSDEGIGDVRLGSPLPARLLAPGSDPLGRYFPGLHADAQTHDGFRLPGFPVRILMAGSGPFTRWFDDPKRKADPPPDAATRRRLAADAVREARAGARVGWIVVDGPGPRTASGIGVGSTLAEVMRAHPAARPRSQPPTFGKDECEVTLAPLKQVQVYFPHCRAARAGARATRMTVMSFGKK